MKKKGGKRDGGFEGYSQLKQLINLFNKQYIVYMVEFILHLTANTPNIIMNSLELKIKSFHVACFFSGDPPCHLLHPNSPDHRPLPRHSERCQLASLEDPQNLNYRQLIGVGR